MIALYKLVRHQDISGVSGTGVVAHAAVFPNGKAVVSWLCSDRPTSIAVYDSFADAKDIHCHGNASEFVPLYEYHDTTHENHLLA